LQIYEKWQNLLEPTTSIEFQVAKNWKNLKCMAQYLTNFALFDKQKEK